MNLCLASKGLLVFDRLSSIDRGTVVRARMDPLGAKQPTCSVSELVLWGAVQPNGLPPHQESSLPNAHSISPFSVRDDLNSKVALW